MTTTGDVLRAAAQRVRQGWCQGTTAVGRNVCAVGAISSVTADTDSYCLAVDAMRQWLDVEGVAIWNDTPGRTKEEVALAFERAADYLDAQQTPAIVWTMREDVPA